MDFVYNPDLWNDWISVGICYPPGSAFTVISDVHDRLSKQTHKTGVFIRTNQREKLERLRSSRGYYFWEEETGLLFLKVKARSSREKFAFCSVKGCERIKITAVIPDQSPPSNCMRRAYPRHSHLPVVDVPMPKRRSHGTQQSEHFLEVRLESFITRFFHIKEDFSFTEVSGRKFYQLEDGIQVTVIDGQNGGVVGSKSFSSSLLQGVPAQLEKYIDGLKDRSIVLVTSKGPLGARRGWTRALQRLGVNKHIQLRDKLVLVGFKGSFRPDWVRLEQDKDHAKIHQVLPVPVVAKMKL